VVAVNSASANSLQLYTNGIHQASTQINACSNQSLTTAGPYWIQSYVRWRRRDGSGEWWHVRRGLRHSQYSSFSAPAPRHQPLETEAADALLGYWRRVDRRARSRPTDRTFRRFRRRERPIRLDKQPSGLPERDRSGVNSGQRRFENTSLTTTGPYWIQATTGGGVCNVEIAGGMYGTF
jgi:hypothetical protein